MTIWDGTRWVPDASASPPAPSRRGRRFLGAVAEALLITGLIFGLIGSTATAAGKQSYGLEYGGVRVWQEPYAFGDFLVTRSKVDRTDVWVKASCLNPDGSQAIAGADPYGHVRWDSSNALVGRATLDSLKNGTSCRVWLTRSIKSGGATGGWPELSVLLDW